MLDGYIHSKKEGRSWELHDVQVLLGLISYYKMVEKDYINYILKQYSEKNNFNIEQPIKTDLSA